MCSLVSVLSQASSGGGQRAWLPTSEWTFFARNRHSASFCSLCSILSRPSGARRSQEQNIVGHTRAILSIHRNPAYPHLALDLPPPQPEPKVLRLLYSTSKQKRAAPRKSIQPEREQEDPYGAIHYIPISIQGGATQQTRHRIHTQTYPYPALPSASLLSKAKKATPKLLQFFPPPARRTYTCIRPA
jgi:hypothetical protein